MRDRGSWRILVVSVLSVLGLAVAAHAQSPEEKPATSLDTAATSAFSRLTVRPHEMPLGQTTTTAGVQEIDSLPQYVLYVPQSAVGTKRVPLVVFFHGAFGIGQMVLDEQRAMADKYGMILLAPTARGSKVDLSGFAQDSASLAALVARIGPGEYGWDTEHATYTGPETGISRNIVVDEFRDVKNISRAMTYVLKNFAIDPDKIAVGGFSAGGTFALFMGRNNEDVFSQVMIVSPDGQFDGGLGPRNKKTRFFLSDGPGSGFPNVLPMAHDIRAEGHDVETMLSVRQHVFLVNERDYAWDWLAQGWNWKAPGAVESFRPVAISDDDPLLTTDALAKMTAFWQAFTSEPDSIQATALKAHQVYGTMMLGQERVIVAKTDLAPIAAAYPAIAAALAKAGLTVQQEEAYRVALMRVQFLNATGGTSSNPTIAQNLEFGKSHAEELAALWGTNIWLQEDLRQKMRK